MNEILRDEFQPNIVFPPGDTLQETLDSLGMTQAELAARMGRPKKTINGIISGDVSITPDTALQLERVLNIPSNFWNNLENKYQDYLARSREESALQGQLDWLKEIPVKDMIKSEWIKAFESPTQQIQEVLNFFGVVSKEQWHKLWENYRYQVAFRKSDESNWGAILAWLRMGEICSQSIHCSPYSSKNFQSALYKIRELTILPPEKFIPEITELCSKAGVATVFIPQLPKTRSSGAARWLTPEKALIQISLRYKKDDQIWFSFFHEAAHILLHSKRPIFLDNEKLSAQEKLEEEANRFAADWLIPEKSLKEFIFSRPQGRISKDAITEFSEKLGISPGIVVGRLQHDRYIPYSHCNGLKRTFRWVKKEN